MLPILKIYLTLILIIVAISCAAQMPTTAPKEVTKPNLDVDQLELGLSYPISLDNKINYFNLYLNTGIHRPINDRYYGGLAVNFKYYQGEKSDFTVGTLLRFGKHLNTKYNLTSGLGYTLKSKKYGNFPGILMEVNLNRTNEYGIHIKYEELQLDDNPKLHNIAIGLHLCDLKARKTFVTGLLISAGGLALAILVAPVST